MKPKEVLDIRDGDYFAGLSEERKLLRKYQDMDCVVAYRKSHLGTTLLIKGKIELFGFIVLSKHIRWGNPEVLRKTLSTIQQSFQSDGVEKLEIVDEENFKIFERRVLLNALEDE